MSEDWLDKITTHWDNALKSLTTKDMNMANTRKVPSKAKKSKKQSGWQRFMGKKYAMPLIFIVAFAVIGGILTLFLTNAATSGSTIVGVANKCLDNAGNRKEDRNKIQLYQCNGTAAQVWNVNSNGTITNANGYCLDVKGAGTTPKTLVQLYHCNGTVAQQWTVKSNGSIVNPHSDLCLDDQYSGTDNGNQIWMWTCNGTAAQKWTIKTPDNGGGSTTPPPSNGGGTGSGGGTTTPPPSNGGGSSNPSGEAMPTGNTGNWKMIFSDDFTGTVPVGAFSDCNHNTDTPQAYCGGLKNYGNYYKNWWAYPNNWDDTAKSGADGNTGAPFGGTYHPEDVVSVSNGAMHVKMFRPSKGGDNHVAALVPRPCMDRKYGRYVERFKVVQANPGFKSAHLFYNGGYEIDYPENDFGDTISAYTHPGEANFSTGAKYTSWHTTAIEWTSGSVKFYMDGKLVGSTTKKVPNISMSWVLQNESSIMGPYAKPGATAQLDTDWVACYAPM